jgi:molybdopterin-containing oxidoreductase family membrane subunit
MPAKNNRPTKFIVWIAVLSLGILAGFFTVYKLLTDGLVILGGSDIVIWTLPLALYVFFALTSTGLTFVAAIPLVFGIRQYELVSKRAVFLAIASLIAAFTALSMDLGSPTNMFAFITAPNLESPIWGMSVLYAIELVVLLIKFWTIHKGEGHGRGSKIIGVIALLNSIVASATLGLVFGTIRSRPAYFGGFAPVYFWVTAFLSGLAMILLFSLAYQHFVKGGLSEDESSNYDGLTISLAFTTGITLVLFVMRMAIGLLSVHPGHAPFVALMGHFSFQITLWLGLVAPLVLMLIPSVRATTWGKVTASSLVLLGLIIERADYVLVGQLKPLGVRASGVSGLVSHSTNIYDWLIFFFALALMLLVYTLGERYLKLETPGQSSP